MVGQLLGKILKIIYCELQSTGYCGEPTAWTSLIVEGRLDRQVTKTININLTLIWLMVNDVSYMSFHLSCSTGIQNLRVY